MPFDYFSLTKNNVKDRWQGFVPQGKGKAVLTGLSDGLITALLPRGVVFHLADLAFLDWAGGTSWMKTFKMK